MAQQGWCMPPGTPQAYGHITPPPSPSAGEFSQSNGAATQAAKGGHCRLMGCKHASMWQHIIRIWRHANSRCLKPCDPLPAGAGSTPKKNGATKRGSRGRGGSSSGGRGSGLGSGANTSSEDSPAELSSDCSSSLKVPASTAVQQQMCSCAGPVLSCTWTVLVCNVAVPEGFVLALGNAKSQEVLRCISSRINVAPASPADGHERAGKRAGGGDAGDDHIRGQPATRGARAHPHRRLLLLRPHHRLRGALSDCPATLAMPSSVNDALLDNDGTRQASQPQGGQPRPRAHTKQRRWGHQEGTATDTAAGLRNGPLAHTRWHRCRRRA